MGGRHAIADDEPIETKAWVVQTRMRATSQTARALGLLLCGLVASSSIVPARTAEAGDDGVSAIVDNEELILNLTPLLDDLDQSAMNLHLPDHKSQHLFDTDVLYNELLDTKPSPDVAAQHHRLADRRDWIIESENHQAPGRELDLWRPLLDEV